jgi:orotate phosphoribosyltransferase
MLCAKLVAKCWGWWLFFTYGFQLAVDKFNEKNCTLDTLSNYEALIEQALASNYIQSADVEVLKEWRLSPDTWKQ